MIPNHPTPNVLRVVDKCNKEGIQVILPNGFLNVAEPFRYHSICGDVYDALNRIMCTFKKAKKNRVALFGASPFSCEDVFLTDTFNSFSSTNNAIFFNTQSTNDCLKEFLAQDYYDAVICANDYVALMLIEHLRKYNPEYLSNLSIVSFSNTILSQICNVPITSLSIDFNKIGDAVIDIYRMIKNNENCNYSATVLYLPYHIHERETTNGLSFSNSKMTTQNDSKLLFDITSSKNYIISSDVAYYSKIDCAFNQLSPKNFTVLMLILRGYSNNEICEKMFISLDALNYHLKKLRNLFEVSSTKVFIEQLKPLISVDYIEKYLKEENKNNK